jgi:aspartate carbamoyltransferase regulatory subunit
MDKKINPRIAPITNGTVLDHLPVGSAMKIIELLKDSKAIMSVAINVDSTKNGKKDLIYIHDYELRKNEIEKIGLVASGGTINTIKNNAIVSKSTISIPTSVHGALTCLNEKCITNNEPIITKFTIRENPMRAKCFYCEKEFDKNSIRKMLSK